MDTLFSPLPLTSGLLRVCAAAILLAASSPVEASECKNRTRSEVLQFISSLHKSQFEKRLLSGQFIGYGDDATFKKEIDPLSKRTGERPFLVGVDYHDYKKGGPRTAKANELLLSYWELGGLVAISNHAGNPVTGGKAKDRPPGWSADDLLKPGSEAFKGWDRELDAVSAGLKELKKKGVVVLWRPFHEMNGGWFWWGKQKPEVFKTLWRRMHDRFQKEKLDNLIWVYSADPDPKTVLKYYPGDGYVDIVGVDVYRSDPENISLETYRKLTGLGKPFAITEYGTGDPKASNHSGLSPLLDAIKAKFPKTAFFMVWYDGWAIHREPDAKAVLSDSWVAKLRDSCPPKMGSMLKSPD